jgi:hypothetical protein
VTVTVIHSAYARAQIPLFSLNIFEMAIGAQKRKERKKEQRRESMREKRKESKCLFLSAKHPILMRQEVE